MHVIAQSSWYHGYRSSSPACLRIWSWFNNFSTGSVAVPCQCTRISSVLMSLLINFRILHSMYCAHGCFVIRCSSFSQIFHSFVCCRCLHERLECVFAISVPFSVMEYDCKYGIFLNASRFRVGHSVRYQPLIYDCQLEKYRIQR